MASSSYIPKTSFKYDVFLSFRGEDTRTNFVDHLYHALKLENIETYKDDENLERGKKINRELIQAIEDSRFHVIVFSKNYASSSWCLDELVKIIECQETSTEHTVYPIFYDVEPTHVRKQSGEFGKAFSKHENDEAAMKWRKALVEATSFSGKDLTVDKREVDFIKLVVKDISLKLPVVSADENVVGMSTRVNGVLSSINATPNEVCMIGIWGMGGGGKTTLARAVFDQICSQFEGSSFVENVRESSTSPLLGLKSLQQQVLRDVFKRQDIFINGVLEGKKEMKKKMHGIKVLVVLDDVDHIDQLKALAGERNWFKKGSVIIITTRDVQVLRSHGVEPIQVNLLSNEEALPLFCMNAFRTEIPVQGYEELSREVVSYAAGLPLTIIVLGSHLHGRSTCGWKGVLKSLKRMPKKEVVDILELSYTRLEDHIKEIFLDVACMRLYYPIDGVVIFLEGCGHFEARCGLDVLKEKSLITISNEGEHVVVHDQIIEMGKDIVRRSHRKEPHKHSHLWETQEIEHILANDLGTEATECIEYVIRELSSQLFMKGLRKMKKLRMLYVCSKSHDGYCFSGDWEFDEVTEYIPNSLQCLLWMYYPFSSLPKTFQANNLVMLGMTDSEIVQLWEGGEKKILKKLKYLYLSDSKLKTLDLGMTPNLKELKLSGCLDLVELLFPLQCLELTKIKLSHTKLRTLDLRGAPNLESLNILCDDLIELHIPAKWPKLKSFNLHASKLTTLDLQGAQNLEKLDVRECDNLEELRIHFNCLKLKFIEIIGTKLRTFDLALTPNLKMLKLSGCHDMVELLFPLQCLELLYVDLSLTKLRILKLLHTPVLSKLRLEGCDDLVEIHIPFKCPSLTMLYLGCCKLRTLDLQATPNLKELFVSKCVDLEELHIPIKCRLNLTLLALYCPKLRSLDILGTLNLERLLIACDDLAELHIPAKWPKLKTLDLHDSKLTTLDLQGAPNLEKLNVSRCYNLEELRIHSNCLMLKSIDIMGAKLMTFKLGLTPNLKRLRLAKCSHLVELQVPEDLGLLECLEELILSECTVLRDIPKASVRLNV